MRFQGLDLNLLVALDALIAERNITRGGERIHLSQSGMSSALARLRTYFEDELFVQQGRELVPTPLAESLAEPVRRVLMELETTIINRPSFDSCTDNRCYRISASELTLMILMPALIQRLNDIAPQIRLELSKTPNFAERLELGDIDLALTPLQFAPPTHPFDELYADDYQVICWEGNTRVGDEISLAEYQQLGHVVVAYGKNQSPAFDGWFMNNSRITRNVEVTTGDLCSPPLLVVGTERIATIHGRLAKQASQTLPIRVLTPPMEIPPLIQTVQYHRNRVNDEGLRWLRTVINEVAQSLNLNTH